jgi:preprotein translocase subunit SecE
MQFFKQIPNFLKEVRTEMGKVNWPTQKETVRYTIFVLGLSAAVAVILGLLDFIYISILRETVLY